LFAVGAVVGAVVGYMRALHQEFSIESETGNVMSKATPLGSILFLGLFVVRFGMSYWIKGGVTPDTTHAPTPQVLLYTDVMLFFAFAMVTASAFEVWRRTRPLILEHKATAQLPPAGPLP
jgi:Kef-type K+ transport system membrane component KefB